MVKNKFDIDEIQDKCLPNKKMFLDFMFNYQQLIMMYESAIQYVKTHLEILKKECEAKEEHVPIRSITSRIKEPTSIMNKLNRKKLPISIKSIMDNINDVAGMRIICPYISDIYTIRDSLIEEPYIDVIKEKDYIENPKQNGYRSLHLIVEVAVPLKEENKKIKCEIQLRTTAMDSWAELEHHLRYKKNLTENKKEMKN